LKLAEAKQNTSPIIGDSDDDIDSVMRGEIGRSAITITED